jgi:hypothetical protein
MLKPLMVPLIFTNTAAVDVELDESAVEEDAADESGVDDGAVDESAVEEGATLVNELLTSELMVIELATIELMDTALDRFAGLLSPPPPHAVRLSAAMAALKRNIGNIKILPVINENSLLSAASAAKPERGKSG